MKIKNSLVFSTILAAALGLSAPVFAQSNSQKKKSPAKQSKPGPKPHKVWTNDEVGSLRSPADAYLDTKYRRTDETATAQQQPTGVKPAHHVGSPALSNPKTLDDADKMIAGKNEMSMPRLNMSST